MSETVVLGMLHRAGPNPILRPLPLNPYQFTIHDILDFFVGIISLTDKAECSLTGKGSLFLDLRQGCC
jgi:hypothetical protein